MARLYSSENFPIPVVEELRKLGHDVLTMQETGKADQSLSDEVVLGEASNDERAVLTFNRKHFIKIHKSRPKHEGIIACTFDIDFVALAKRIHQAIETLINNKKGVDKFYLDSWRLKIDKITLGKDESPATYIIGEFAELHGAPLVVNIKPETKT